MGKKKDKQHKAVDRKVPSANLSHILQTANHHSAVHFLVAPTDYNEFMLKHWEQQPLLSRATEFRKAFFSGMFDLAELEKLLASRERSSKEHGEPPLEFEQDLTAARYRDGAKHTFDGEEATKDSVLPLYHDQGATLQFHQPQRFNDPLWHLLAALEAELGCLVGCNAYLTPPKSQGLAPHHDDVELFVVQTEGSKRWRLYKPLNGFQLPSEVSGDLDPEEIGEPILDITLQVGDVLYLPRGTVHQAEAQEGPSSHLTISTYQHWNWGSLLGSCLQFMAGAQQEPEALPLELRRGLPPGILWNLGLQAELAKGPNKPNVAAKEAASKVAEGLRKLADHLEENPELLAVGIQPMAADFLRSRLPPHPAMLPGRGPEPSIDSRLVARGSRNFLLTFKPKSQTHCCEEEEEEEEEDDTAFVRLCSNLTNSRETHMMPAAGDSDDEDEDMSDEEGEESDEEGEESDEEAPEAVPIQMDSDPVATAARIGADANTTSTAGTAAAGASGKGTGEPEEKAVAKAIGKSGEGKVVAAPGKQQTKAAAACGDAPTSKSGACSDHLHHHHHHHHHDGCCHSHGHGKKRKRTKGEVEHDHSVEEEDDEDEIDLGDMCEEKSADDGVPGLLLPGELAEAVVKVLEAGPEGIAVKDLPLQFDAEKMQLAFQLWAEGVVGTRNGGGPAAQKQSMPKKKAKKGK